MPTRRLKMAAALAAALPHHPDVAGDIAGALLRGRIETARRMARTAAKPPDFSGALVSRKYRCLWMRNTKVASESILMASRCSDPDAAWFGVDRSVSASYAQCPAARDYFTFAFVRHPFARALSFYSDALLSPETYTGEQRIHKTERRQSYFNSCYGLAEVGSFDDYCQWLNTLYAADWCADRHYRSQRLQLRLDDGRRPDFTRRFENLAADWNSIATRLGLPETTLPMLNTVAGWQAPSLDALEEARARRGHYLTERNKALLRRRYADDLEIFSYAPD